MRTGYFSVRIIPAHWRKRAILAIFSIAVPSTLLLSQSASPETALSQLKAGVAARDSRRYTEAIARFLAAGAGLPKIGDYAAYFRAGAQFDNADYAAVPKSLAAVWEQTLPSPLAARSALLAARAYQQINQPLQAVDVLRKHYSALPQPQGDLVMAQALAKAQDGPNAVLYYQRVYYNYPLSPEATEASDEAWKLRAALGDKYPPPTAQSMLGRALKLLDGGQTLRARKELETLVGKLSGGDRDTARVRIGAAEYAAKNTDAAYRYLKTLEVESPEADAERLSYLVSAARRLNNQDEVTRTLDRLARLYPNSKWRLDALIAAGNHYLLLNQIDAYEPLYRAGYEAFPNDRQAAYCHWKVVWGHYLRRQPDAADMLKAHLRNYPASPNAAAALYFLGRLAENSGDRAAARAYYDEILQAYPNYFYTTLARERLSAVRVAASPATMQFLGTIQFPLRQRSLEFRPNSRASERLERARLLASAGLDEWAETELRFGAQNEDQPHLLAMELATISNRRVGPDQAMRWIKRFAASYLFWPLDSAPDQFWKLAFPLPWRDDLERFSRQNELDPFLVAALIRQESEFNPKAVSRADARGLTQIRPITGRELSRKLQVRPYSTPMLFQPVVNLRLGTHHLRAMIDRLDGKIELALAAYNAGPTRALAWRNWAEFREPAEFIETIPFTETREYVQTVLRNADVYRRLYAGPIRASNE
jgi:soluble lytic murein transglycosylase